MNEKQKSNDSKQAAAVIELRHGGKAVIRGHSFEEDWGTLVEAVLLDELQEYVENEESGEIERGLITGAEYALRQLSIPLLWVNIRCLLTVACLKRLEQAVQKRDQFIGTAYANN